jgi:hypothetical protein
MSKKECRKCGQTKELTEFCKHPQTKDGRQSYCRSCSGRLVKQYKKSATPCVYRIRHKETGEYYLGQTKVPLCYRVSNHFHLKANVASPFTGKSKKDYEWEVLCYGTLDQVKQVEKELLLLRVGIDPKCLNKHGGKQQ